MQEPQWLSFLDRYWKWLSSPCPKRLLLQRAKTRIRFRWKAGLFRPSHTANELRFIEYIKILISLQLIPLVLALVFKLSTIQCFFDINLFEHGNTNQMLNYKLLQMGFFVRKKKVTNINWIQVTIKFHGHIDSYRKL